MLIYQALDYKGEIPKTCKFTENITYQDIDKTINIKERYNLIEKCNTKHLLKKYQNTMKQ
jgi:hypothetical protein